MRLLNFTLWIIVLFLVTGCSINGFSFGQQQASTENGQITVYTTLPQEQVDAYLALFNAEYPDIQVEVFRESTGAITDKLLAEADEPQADVIWGMPLPIVMLAEWKFMLHGYAPVGLDRIEANFRDHANPPHWVGITGWKSVFCVNREKLSQLQIPAPQSALDLVDPIYSGQIVIPNPTTSGTALLLMAAIFELQNEVVGWEYLDGLHQNVAEYTHSGAEPCRLVAEGQYAIGVSNDVTAAALKSEGKPIDIVFPSEGIGWGMDVNALVNKKNIQPAAKTFLDWAISDSAMNKYAERFAMIAVKRNTPLPAGYVVSPKAQLVDVSFPWITANSKRILDEWYERYGKTLAP